MHPLHPLLQPLYTLSKLRTPTTTPTTSVAIRPFQLPLYVLSTSFVGSLSIASVLRKSVQLQPIAIGQPNCLWHRSPPTRLFCRRYTKLVYQLPSGIRPLKRKRQVVWNFLRMHTFFMQRSTDDCASEIAICTEHKQYTVKTKRRNNLQTEKPVCIYNI